LTLGLSAFCGADSCNGRTRCTFNSARPNGGSARLKAAAIEGETAPIHAGPKMLPRPAYHAARPTSRSPQQTPVVSAPRHAIETSHRLPASIRPPPSVKSQSPPPCRRDPPSSARRWPPSSRHPLPSVRSPSPPPRRLPCPSRSSPIVLAAGRYDTTSE
jgi:hypothetical protein